MKRACVDISETDNEFLIKAEITRGQERKGWCGQWRAYHILTAQSAAGAQPVGKATGSEGLGDILTRAGEAVVTEYLDHVREPLRDGR